MKKDRSNTLNVCFVISIVLHVLVILLIPVSWFAGGGLNIYAVEPYGISDGNPFETSIAYTETQQSKTATTATKTTVTTQAAEPKKAQQPKPATTPKPEPPKPEPPKTSAPPAPKPEPTPEPSKKSPEVKKVEPVKIEEPKVSAPEPAKVDVKETVTTTNPDADVSIPVEEPVKQSEPVQEPEPAKEPEPTKEPEPEETERTDSTGAKIEGETSSGGSDTGQGEAEVPPAPKTVSVKGSSLFLGGFGIVYPKDAVAEKAKGVVKVDIRVNPDGRLAGVDVLQSSGYQSLDEHAIDRVSQGPFKAMGQAYVLPAEVTFTDVGMNAKVNFGDVVFRED